MLITMVIPMMDNMMSTRKSIIRVFRVTRDFQTMSCRSPSAFSIENKLLNGLAPIFDGNTI